MSLTKFTLPVLLLGSHLAAAQASTKTAAKTHIAADVCDCLTKKAATGSDASLSKEQATDVFRTCFMSTAGKDMKLIQQAYGQTAYTDKVLMRTLGEEVGAQLMQDCPAALKYFVAMSGSAGGAGSTAVAATTGQTTGQLGGLSGPGVTLLEIQVGKTEKVYFAWLRHFEQADELLSKLADLRGRTVRVSWQEVEVLQPDTRQYQKVREITGLELL